jgi:hypothetical protein
MHPVFAFLGRLCGSLRPRAPGRVGGRKGRPRVRPSIERLEAREVPAGCWISVKNVYFGTTDTWTYPSYEALHQELASQQNGGWQSTGWVATNFDDTGCGGGAGGTPGGTIGGPPGGGVSTPPRTFQGWQIRYFYPGHRVQQLDVCSGLVANRVQHTILATLQLRYHIPGSRLGRYYRVVQAQYPSSTDTCGTDGLVHRR